MNRRKFIKGVGTLAAADAALSLFPYELQAQDFLIRRAAQTGLNIMQGLTTETTTQLSIDLAKTAKVAYALIDRETGRAIQPTRIKKSENAKSSSRADKVLFTGLELGHQYQFNVIDINTNKNLDERYLSTVDLSKTNARIAVMSCMKDDKSALKTMWPSALAVPADYYFFIGDAVYGDSVFSHGTDKLWSRFIETRTTLPFYRWKTLKPTLAVWDDHDYGKNNEDGNYKHKAGTLNVFKSFFAQDPVEGALSEGPGLSFHFHGFNQNFLFLDCRYFRKLNNKGITGFLGAEQMTWANSRMQNSNSPAWVLQGSPFFGRSDKSSTSYQATAPQELDLFLKDVSRWGAPAAFFGGDLHYSEISECDKKYLGYNTYEFVSSCMHSSTKSGYYQNPNKRLQSTLKENFLLLEKTGLRDDPSWKVSCVGENSKLLFNGVYQVG